MELRDYAKIVRKNWAGVVAAALLGVILGIGVSLLMTSKYESTSQVYVSVRSTDEATSDLVQGSNFAQQAVSSYMEIATSAIVLEQVVEELALEESVQTLSSKITVTSPADTVLMDITVTDSDPQRAAEIANVTGAVLSDVVENEIEISSGDNTGPVQIETIQPGVVPEDPVSPRVTLNGVLGLLIGLAVGFGLAILRAVLDTRFHSLNDLGSAFDAPILGGIAHDPEADKRPLIVHSDHKNPRAESFRSLRTNLGFVATESGTRVFTVSSSVADEGKTTTAANLAIALAETGASVVLIDADLRVPSVANIMGIEGGIGLTDVLIDQAELRDVMQPWGREELSILPAGRVPPNPSELLGSQAMQRVLQTLGETNDYVLVDTPPLLPVTDAAVVSGFATGMILVAAAGSTKQHEVEEAVETLETSGVRLLGLVATKLPTKGPDSYARGLYSYGYGVEDEPVTSERKKANPRRAKPATWKR